MLKKYGLEPTRSDAERHWAWLDGTDWAAGPGAKKKSQPLFLYGDEAQFTDYADKVLGVYMGFLQATSKCF